MRILPLLFALFLAATPAIAQEAAYYKLSTGTGFVINNDGHVITNDHVVRGCQSIAVLTPKGEEAATLVAHDSDKDLAVLKTNYLPQVNAPLRWNIDDLKVGDPVVVMGFPGESGSRGVAQYRKSSVTALRGPTGEEKWIQLQSVAAKGNSGGPVLDGSGNVIGVVTGNAMIYKVDTSTGALSGAPIGKSDVSITLEYLRDFLSSHAIGFYQSASGLLTHSDARIHESATHFILPVRCIQGVEYR